ncbi:MAG: hypothetical protein BroJett013_35780 [Alphaproteobacteria bacterium]|nr:MAG: hypothetical protein BroJett013_35780 [Alphaproteobacteria bacterium]
MESEETKTEEIAALLAEARTHVQHITANLPVIVDPLETMQLTTARAPHFALCIREVQTWRAEEFARAACDMFERGDLVVGVSNVRGAVESVAVIWYLKCLIEAEIERGVADPNIYDKFRQIYLGSRSEEALPQAINVITMLKRLEKDIPGVWRGYERMSDFCHPNYQGALAVFCKHDRETHIAYFGRGIRNNLYPAKLGLRSLVGALGLLQYAYNKIADMNDPFCSACGKALGDAA